MIQDKVRKEVSLDKTIIEKLKIKAQEDGRNLKNYLEKVLTEKANDDFEITEDYMKMIDEMLEKKEKGLINFTSWEEVKKKFNR
ncbi:hypothetical protein Q73A0000_11805 [Kaistella flava (ex Peng et al. 2021)]|uniref:Uncharacterized protein n=1 Tax=Kaistella flava (ex Peng et al. 2021) TaxID=2038776 RepID=A0A7M2YC88_9FLAO|nr:hypothetical protein [Kaistella flava (ex Peng et al. 2021)]QOW10993.1 hypothetical protein Q73A0000_11805 [Kaistella flava (ex Peng et al. 2021)]